MSDILLFSDEHFGCNNNNKLIFEEQLLFFENQVFPYILQHKIKDVISLGDVTDSRTTIDLYIQQELKQRFFQWFEKNKVTAHFLLANHSIYFKNVNTHHFFKENFDHYNYVKYYDTITKFNVGKYVFGIVPWVMDNNVDDLPKPNEIDILLLHTDIKKFKMTKGIDCKNGFNPTDLKSYKMVLSGHFHLKQSMDNIHYLGNPYQKDWGCFGEDKGFYTLDDNFNLTFHLNEISPKFLKVIYSDKDGIQVIGE